MNRSVLFGLFVGASALTFSSCAYDPYQSGRYGGGYGGGFGNGYGYGGSGFSTSFFVSTGNPRWGYDPYAGAYFDHIRRCYYDPHLYGYYPLGYRPRYVFGSPHPYGWSSGSGYCPPPTVIRSYNLTNYDDRAERYRSLGRSWSNKVRVDSPETERRPGTRDRIQNVRPSGQEKLSGHGDRHRDDSRVREMRGSTLDSGAIKSSDPNLESRNGGRRTREYAPQRRDDVKLDPRIRERRSETNERSIRSAPQIQRQSAQIDSRAMRSARQTTQSEERSPNLERQSRQVEKMERRGERERERLEKNEESRIRGLGEG